jgi:DNA polymerase IV (DinB-like DNA polymerase)
MVRSARLPGAPDDGNGGEEPIVCHVDVDCFYAACERLREPPLRGEPVVVGMGYEAGQRHGAVATASYEAREFGVESAQPISAALDRLPRKVDAAGDPDLDVDAAGFYRPVDMEFYESVAADVRAVLHEHADVVREVSIDEAYLDVSDRVGWDGAEAFAADLKSRIGEAVGVTASVGVAPTMSAAKVASDREKPDGLVVVDPGTVRDFFAPLPVESVHGVGPVTASELREMGVETAGDLAGTDPDAVADRFGERGLEVRRFARGEDDRPVEPRGDPKSLSRESAFTEATAEAGRHREVVRSLAEAVAERATRQGALYRTIGIKVVTPPFDVNTRAETLPGPVDDGDLVREVALDLLEEFEDEAVRKLGVRVSKLTFAPGDQAALDSYAGAADGSDGGSGDGGTADWADDRADGDSTVRTADGTESRTGTGAGSDPGGEAARSLLPGQRTLDDFR